MRSGCVHYQKLPILAVFGNEYGKEWGTTCRDYSHQEGNPKVQS